MSPRAGHPQQSVTDVALVRNTIGNGFTKNDRPNVSTPRADEQRNAPSSFCDMILQAGICILSCQ